MYRWIVSVVYSKYNIFIVDVVVVVGDVVVVFSYVDVGVQKFISRSSDGRAWILRGVVFGFACAVDACRSSFSSLMCDEATDVVDDVVSRCMPKRLDSSHPREPSDGLVMENVAVKYGFWDRRMDLGEPSGEAGNDFDPRRISKRDGVSDWPGASISSIGSANTSSASLLKLLFWWKWDVEKWWGVNWFGFWRDWRQKRYRCTLMSILYTYFATVNPRPNDFAVTIWWATFTIELPHAAPGPLKPSSVPNDFGGCFTLSITNSVQINGRLVNIDDYVWVEKWRENCSIYLYPYC